MIREGIEAAQVVGRRIGRGVARVAEDSLWALDLAGSVLSPEPSDHVVIKAVLAVGRGIRDALESVVAADEFLSGEVRQ